MASLEDIMWNIDSAYCYILNGVSKDLQDDVEKECKETLDFVNKLYNENKYYRTQLNNIKNIVVCNEDDISKEIIDVLDN